MNQNKIKAAGTFDRKSRYGIRWKLFGYMMIFLFLLLGILWLFQVVFFGEIYKWVRISEIKNSASTLAESAELGDYRLSNIAEEISKEKQVCVLVFDEYGHILASCDSITDCIIHEMPAKTIRMLYDFAGQSGGDKITRFKLDGFRGLELVGEENPFKKLDSDSTESIIYTKIVYSEEKGHNVAVMLNATISPVISTVRALQGELMLISGAMVLIAAVLSFLLAKRISKPIVSITESAKELASGNYSANFKAGGYREIAELSDTMTYAAKELSKTDNLQKELTANISHDLRTPLTMIKGYAEMMRDIPDENSAENLQIIIDETERLSSLVNDVLDISKLQSGVEVLNISEFNLTETVNEVIERFSKLPATMVRTVHFDYNCQAMVKADRTRILQVVYNFIANALNHSGEDSEVTVCQKIIDGENGVKQVLIEVVDKGEGISPEDIDKIWDRYYKADKCRKRTQTGSGLGLSIVKGILELHRAKYGVTSEVGKGSKFWFIL